VREVEVPAALNIVLIVIAVLFLAIGITTPFILTNAIRREEESTEMRKDGRK